MGNGADCDYHHIKLDGVNLRGGDFSHATFHHCDLSNADLREGFFARDADFRNAKLDGARFTYSALVGARFDGASAVRADFSFSDPGGPPPAGCQGRSR